MTDRQKQSVIKWCEGHGLTPRLIPRGGIDVLPNGDGRTLIRWEEWVNVDADTFDPSRRVERRRVVDDAPPAWVRAGEVVSVTGVTCPHCSKPLPELNEGD